MEERLIVEDIKPGYRYTQKADLTELHGFMGCKSRYYSLNMEVVKSPWWWLPSKRTKSVMARVVSYEPNDGAFHSNPREVAIAQIQLANCLCRMQSIIKDMGQAIDALKESRKEVQSAFFISK